MLITVHGMLCDFDLQGKKDKQGNPIPTVDVYTGGDIVKIKGLAGKKELIGKHVDILCDFKLVEIDGKTYKVLTACKEQ